MKYIKVQLLTLAFLVGGVGCASADISVPPVQSEAFERSVLSAQEHVKKAQDLEQEVARLTDKVFKLDQRVSKYKKKPYLDTKGFRRSSLKLLIGNTMKKIRNLREQVAWHRSEASSVEVSEKASPEVDVETKQSSMQRLGPPLPDSSTLSDS